MPVADCPDIQPVSTVSFSNPHPVETRELAKLLFTQGLKPSVIACHTGVKLTTVYMWINRYHWQNLLSENKEVLKNVARNAVPSESKAELSAVSSKLRQKLSTVIEAQIAVLEKSPPKSIKDLANTRERQGQAAVVKSIIDGAATLLDWKGESTPGMVMIGHLNIERPEPPAIQIQATVSPACGVEATTNSVPQNQGEQQTPQVAEQVKPQ